MPFCEFNDLSRHHTVDAAMMVGEKHRTRRDGTA
jgi:hypothetical protein